MFNDPKECESIYFPLPSSNTALGFDCSAEPTAPELMWIANLPTRLAHPAIFSTPRLYRSSTMVPSTHIAAVINEKGDVELKKVAVPKAGENEVLVKVAAAALNPADCACHMSGILYV